MFVLKNIYTKATISSFTFDHIQLLLLGHQFFSQTLFYANSFYPKLKDNLKCLKFSAKKKYLFQSCFIKGFVKWNQIGFNTIRIKNTWQMIGWIICLFLSIISELCNAIGPIFIYTYECYSQRKQHSIHAGTIPPTVLGAICTNFIAYCLLLLLSLKQ